MAKESSGQAVSRNQLILIGVLFAVLLGAVYFLFLKGDGSEPTSAAAPDRAPAEETNPAEEEDEKQAPAPKKKSKGPVETSEVFGGKDPFEPVVDLTASDAGSESTAASETDTSTTDTGTTTTDTGDTTTPTAPAPPIAPTPPDDGDDDPSDVQKTGYVVRLLKIFTEDGERTALVETTKRETGKRKLHELVAGDRFRVVFKLTSMDKR
ncbi:MAG: hypothetical protein ACRDK3_15205, partial [Actinomycetota bacterium]